MNAPVKDAERVIEVSAESFSRKEKRALPMAQSAGNAGSLLQAIERVASNPEIDIEKIERMFAMHQQMVKQEAEAAFNGALARAQANIVPIATNAYNDHTKSKYAKLAAINKAITPVFAAEGLSISFDTADSPTAGYLRIIAIVAHAQGHKRQYHIDLPPDATGTKGTVNKTGVQATGSTNSYARRYLVLMIANCSTEDDNDGNGGGNGDDPKGLSESQFADFETKIDEFTDPAALAEFWNLIVKACNEAKDLESYKALKAKVAAKGTSLKKGKSK